MKLTRILGFLSFFVISTSSANGLLSVEGDLTWQSLNDARIPGNSGTLLALTDFGKGPFAKSRIYAGYKWKDKHELRMLYAPLSVELQGQFASPVSFQGQSFAAGTPSVLLYKFNSYRLTYAYHFEEVSKWNLALGFTAKIRDAEIRISQGALIAGKPNVGFVPLLNFQAVRELSEDWRFRADLDGLAAPQGRAFDLALFVERSMSFFGAGHRLSAFAGYRTIEGGADNDEVYTFAWLHKAVLGVRGDF